MPSPSVLLVDDNDFHREVVAESLRQTGYVVIECNSVDAAIGVLNRREVRFSAFVLDAMIGYELERTWFLLDRIKRAHALAPVLLLTAHASAEIAVKAMKSGAIDIVRKPNDHHFTVGARFNLSTLRTGSSRCGRTWA